jgi:uncharacterized repeat protein (TIGR03803 family)
MKCNRNVWTQAADLMVILVVLVLTPGGRAQNRFKTLHTFKDGNPVCNLIFDKAGNLYGTASREGVLGDGVVFRLTPNQDGSWTESVLYSFCSRTNCVDGIGPGAGLTFDKAGNLYGTTTEGGSANGGTVFKLTPNLDGSWTESVLHSFGVGHDGADPTGLTFDAAGNLYGTTQYGGRGALGSGTVFKLTPNQDGSWTENVLYYFCSLMNCQDGKEPYGTLIFDQLGNLYGTTVEGGFNDLGVVFKLTPNGGGSWTERVLYGFCSLTKCRDGAELYAGVIFDPEGNLYGTTDGGGTVGDGVAFRLKPNRDGTWTESVLHNFCSVKDCADGKQPYGGLIFDQSGNLYGTTYFGGSVDYCRPSPGCGVVFRLAPNPKGGWKETVLHVFVDHPGALPFESLTFDGAGNLYGTTLGDFANTHGSIFEITP